MANLYDQAQAYRADLLRSERRAATEMVRSYRVAYERISRELDALKATIADKRAAGIPDADIPSLLYREGRLQRLQVLVREQVGNFAKGADVIIGGAIGDALEQGTKHAADLVQLALPEGISVTPSGTVDPNTGRLSVSPFAANEVGIATGAAEQITAFTRAGAPVGKLLAELGPDAAKAVTDALTSGVVMGKNPNVVAREMRQALGGNLTRALTISRTESLRAYREASRSVYSANTDVLAGWVWVADLSNRTCPACWAQHGSVHPVDEVMATHPRCRCTMAPKTKSWRELGFGSTPEAVTIEDGPTAFRRLSDADQRKVLGPAKYEAFKRREITLPDLVAERNSPVWGPSTGEASLRQAKDNAALRRIQGNAVPPAAPDVVLPPEPSYAPGAVRPSETVDVFKAGSGAKGETARQVRDALDALDELLRIPAGRNEGGVIKVAHSTATRTAGVYRRWDNYAGQYQRSQIRIATSADGEADGVFLHEFGHYVDSEVLASGEEFATLMHSDPMLDGWRQAIGASTRIAEIASRYGTDKRYFLKAEELWARSFAQWVALRTGRTEMLGRVRSVWKWYEGRYGVNPQWDDVDFEPIANAIDELMRSKGWLV